MKRLQDACTQKGEDFFPEGCVITIGNFDGVHRGHRMLIRQAAAMAKAEGLPLVILTFWPYESRPIPGKSLTRIYTEEQKCRRLEETAPDAVMLELAFDETLRNMDEERFFQEILLGRYHCRGLAVGDNFRYGYRGSGDVETLFHHCREAGIPFEAVPGLTFADTDGPKTISSTAIRRFLTEGAVERVNDLLGSPYHVEGEVLHGKHLGHTLGFPTVNLLLPEGLTEPKHGVYHTRVTTPYGTVTGVTNVGLNPTVEHGNRVKIETYLLDFDQDLYGQIIRVEFLSFRREEHRFAGVDELQKQLQRDIEGVRTLAKEETI